MKKFVIGMMHWIATMPMSALVLGAIVGVSLPPYTHPLAAEIGRSAFAALVVIGSWFLARWLARKSLTNRRISYDR